jgi:hypothetical protein
MTDTATPDDARARRVAALTAAARAKTQAKTQAAEQAIRTLIKRGDPVTFQAVQRQAGVSHAFLNGHPELRLRIEQLRTKARLPHTVTADTPPDPESTLVLALTDQITRLKREHRQQIQALHAALEQAHGENLDLRRQLTRASLPTTTTIT